MPDPGYDSGLEKKIAIMTLLGQWMNGIRTIETDCAVLINIAFPDFENYTDCLHY